MSSRKSPIMGLDGPAPVVLILKEYSDTQNESLLERTLFRHIVKYMSADPDLIDKSDLAIGRMFGFSSLQVYEKNQYRLIEACRVFSYSLEELDYLKDNGKTAIDIAREIANRK